jgi:hypothetical protein
MEIVGAVNFQHLEKLVEHLNFVIFKLGYQISIIRIKGDMNNRKTGNRWSPDYFSPY